MHFLGTSSAGTATFTNAAGRPLRFADASTAGNAWSTTRRRLLDVSGMTRHRSASDRLSGAGRVALGATQLTVGGLDRTDTISGSSPTAAAVRPASRGTGGGS